MTKYLEWFRLGAVITAVYYLVISVLLVLLLKVALPANTIENLTLITKIAALLGVTGWVIVGAIVSVGGGLSMVLARFVETKLKFKLYRQWKASLIFKVLFIESMIWTILAIPLSLPFALIVLAWGIGKAFVKSFVNKWIAHWTYSQFKWRLPG